MAVRPLYVDRRLTNASIAYPTDGLIADQVFPVVPVPDKTGKILEVDRSSLIGAPLGDDAIAPGQYAPVIKEGLRDKTYSTVERAESTFLHDDDTAADDAAGQPYRPRLRKTNLVTQVLRVNREIRVATLLNTAANWATGHTSTPATKWDAATGSDPIADITTAKRKVKDDLGLLPNLAVIPWEVMTYLANNSSVRALVNGGATMQNPAVDQSQASMIALMQRIFGIERILVPSAASFGSGGNMKAGFQAGTPSTTGGLFSDNVWIGYVPIQPAREIPSAGYTYVWENAFDGAARENEQGIVVTEERDDRARGQYITARRYSDEKVLVTEAGYVITNTLTAI